MIIHIEAQATRQAQAISHVTAILARGIRFDSYAIQRI